MANSWDPETGCTGNGLGGALLKLTFDFCKGLLGQSFRCSQQGTAGVGIVLALGQQIGGDVVSPGTIIGND